MDFAEVMRKRRMIRSYQDVALPEEVVERVVRNGLRAPSAGFAQGWGFLVLTEAADRERFWAAAGEPGMPGGNTMTLAPLVVVALSHKRAYLDRYAAPDKGWTDRSEERWPVPYWDIDASFAALLMHLTAIDLGLGSCFAGIPAPGSRRSRMRSRCRPSTTRWAMSPPATRHRTRRPRRCAEATARSRRWSTAAAGSPVFA